MISYLELRAGNQIQQLKVLFSHECGRRYSTHITDLLSRILYYFLGQYYRLGSDQFAVSSSSDFCAGCMTMGAQGPVLY
jgi:hypothetical protein